MSLLNHWQVAALLLTAGLVLPPGATGEELCPECAQKGFYGHAQKHGGKGYQKGGAYQKGHQQKGKAHGVHLREHQWFFSDHPPDAPIFESAAIRRVPLPQQVNFRIQREAGQLRSESAPAPQAESAAAPTDDINNINQRLLILEQHVTRLQQSLEKLVDQLQPE